MISFVSSTSSNQDVNDPRLQSANSSLDNQWQLVVEHVSSHGASTITMDRSQQTPLTFAVLNKDIQLCQKLINLKIDLNVRDSGGKPPLFLAMPNIEIMELLVNAGADVHAVIFDLPILHWAVVFKNLNTIKFLLDKQADVNATDKGLENPFIDERIKKTLSLPVLKNGMGMTPLMLACVIGEYEVAQLLLKYEANVHFLNVCRLRAFDFALEINNEKLCLLLIEHGANINNGYLHRFCATNNHAKIRLILRLGADINKYDEQRGETPLHVAVQTNSIETIELLLKNKADINKLDKRGGDSPLSMSIMLKNFQIIKLLIENKANVNTPNKKGQTPLDLTTLSYTPEVIQLLFNNGALVKNLNAKGYTPMLNIFLNDAKFLQRHTDMMIQDGCLTSRLLKLRLLGHRFSLLEKIYGALPQQATFPELAMSIDRYVREDWLNRSWLHPIPFILDQAVNTSLTAKDYADKVKNGETIALHVGWPKHAVSLVFNKFQDTYRLAKGNRGDRGIENYPKPGITFYIIHSLDKLENVITTLLKGVRKPLEDLPLTPDKNKNKKIVALRTQESKHFFEVKMNEDLGLEKEYFLKLKEQKGRNCGWEAAKMSARSMIAFSFLSPQRGVNESALISKPIYKSIAHFDRQLALQEAEDLEGEPQLKEITSFDNLYRDLAFSCAKKGREEMFYLIMKRRPHLINVKSRSNDQSLLYQATRKQAAKIVSYLLEKGVDHTFKNSLRESSLHYASFGSKKEIVQSLIEHGADIEDRTKNKRTPLMIAADEDEIEIVKLLLDHGAKVNQYDDLGWTSFHFACKNGNLDLCRELIEHKANIHSTFKDGSTPLTLAISYKHLIIVDYLMKLGLKANENDLKIAREVGDYEILTLLQS